MAFFPEILPADPAAPEGYFHNRKPKTGLVGWIERQRVKMSVRRLRRSLSPHTLRDIGLADGASGRLGGISGSSWNAPAIWTKPGLTAGLAMTRGV